MWLTTISSSNRIIGNSRLWHIHAKIIVPRNMTVTTPTESLNLPFMTTNGKTKTASNGKGRPRSGAMQGAISCAPSGLHVTNFRLLISRESLCGQSVHPYRTGVEKSEGCVLHEFGEPTSRRTAEFFVCSSSGVSWRAQNRASSLG